MPERQNLYPARTSSSKAKPEDYGYKFLRLASGPTGTGGLNYNMNTDSDGDPSVFEWEVPTGRIFTFVRINFVFVDAGIGPGDFGGIAGALSNGCLFEIVDANGNQVLDFTDGVPIVTNEDFSPLAGSDVPIVALAGEDMLPIRFTIEKAGQPMELTAGEKLRWTNQDDLGAITKFRAMVQGTYSQ